MRSRDFRQRVQEVARKTAEKIIRSETNEMLPPIEHDLNYHARKEIKSRYKGGPVTFAVPGGSKNRKPSNHKINRLVAILQTALRPVLIHCKAGADRSGLAAAIWKVNVDKEPKSRPKSNCRSDSAIFLWPDGRHGYFFLQNGNRNRLTEL